MTANLPADQTGVTPAVLRITRSRIALQQALRKDDDQQETFPSTNNRSDGGLLAGLRQLKGQPGAHLLLRSVKQMWEKNPWHVLGQSAVEAAGIVLTPVAKRSPVALVAGAFAIGAAVYFARPWRFVTKNSLLAGLLVR